VRTPALLHHTSLTPDIPQDTWSLPVTPSLLLSLLLLPTPALLHHTSPKT
jgi:hypothetical protein